MKRTIVVAGLIASLGVGVGVGTAAHASSYPTLSTTSRTEVLVSPKCYREHEVTRTYFHWSTKAGGYVAYPAPKTTTTDSTHCHA
jgi:hypothetical protein